MKIHLFLLLFFGSLSPFSARAGELLTRRISLELRETPLKTALEEVAKKGDFEWSYNSKIIDGERRVSLFAKNWTVRETLFELLGDGFEFKPSGNHLILKRQKASKNERIGTVRDPKTGKALANATVFDRRTLRATTTDSSGFYRLKVKKRSELVVAKIGYRDTILAVNSTTPRFQKTVLVADFPPTDSISKPFDFKKSVQKTATELEHFFSATLDRWHSANVRDTLERRFQLSLVPKIGTNFRLDGQVSNAVSINILAGQSKNVRVLELGGLGNFTKNDVRGGQAGGAFNVVHGLVTGVQAAGAFNQTNGKMVGAQLAGAVNVAQKGPVSGVQIAGFGNLSGKTAVKGVQIAGFLNTANEVKGVQIAGGINHARRVRGFQIGLFNRTEKLSGVQIGIWNKSGRRSFPIINFGF